MEPDVAVMFDAPPATPVASPDAFTVATAGTELAHVNVVPVTALLSASNAVAVNCCVTPWFTVAVAGDTVMLVTTGAGPTVRLADPTTEPEVAVIVAVPSATPVARPLASTVAFALLLAHVNVTPEIGLSDASLAVAVNWTVRVM